MTVVPQKERIVILFWADRWVGGRVQAVNDLAVRLIDLDCEAQDTFVGFEIYL